MQKRLISVMHREIKYTAQICRAEPVRDQWWSREGKAMLQICFGESSSSWQSRPTRNEPQRAEGTPSLLLTMRSWRVCVCFALYRKMISLKTLAVKSLHYTPSAGKWRLCFKTYRNIVLSIPAPTFRICSCFPRKVIHGISAVERNTRY